MAFNAQDLNDQNNNRAEAIKALIDFCMEHNLDYSYTSEIFGVKLPAIDPLPTITHLSPQPKRKKFDISNWGPKGPTEGEEADPEQPLTEGEPPKESY